MIQLARQYGDFKVTERVFTMDEMVEASKENRIYEAFGCGKFFLSFFVKIEKFIETK